MMQATRTGPFAALNTLALLSLFAAGCASQSAHVARPPLTAPTAPVHTSTAMVTHTVAPKETLWSISKRYGVSYSELMRVNRIKDASQLPVGQTLLIPEPLAPSSAQPPPLPPIPLYPNPRWTHIVIHHSATATGNVNVLDKAHRRRGFTNGLGYHFVIDNGTSNRRDGQIEIGPRWKKQQHGAHCNAGGMNYHGIGICVVGDFTKRPISQSQMSALVALVKQLERYYGIPESKVIRHRDVRGKKTACPGNRFPWTEFKRRLAQARS